MFNGYQISLNFMSSEHSVRSLTDVKSIGIFTGTATCALTLSLVFTMEASELQPISCYQHWLFHTLYFSPVTLLHILTENVPIFSPFLR